MNSPTYLWPRLIFALAILGTLSSCTENSSGPIAAGASHGSLGSQDMSDYFYKKQAGWVYAWRNVEHIYNTDGTTTTLTGANDTIRTLGANGIAPNGDTLYRYEITYRVLSAYAGRGELNVRYVCDGNSQHGAFIDCAQSLPGERSVDKSPRPVSTDTILAGVAGRVRTMVDDFSNLGSYLWQKDTLWTTSKGDSTFIWEHPAPGQTGLIRSRLLFCRNFVDNTSWVYDQIYGRTTFKVVDPNQSLDVPYGSFNHVVKIAVITPNVADNMPITEHKWFACGTGLVKQHDDWYVTTNGSNRIEEDFTRSLISLTHP